MVLDQDDELDVNGKTIVCRLTQWDLLTLNVGFMPRLGVIWAGLLLLALGAGFGVVVYDGLSELARTLLVLASAAALLGALASMAGFLFAIGIVSSSPVDNPLLIDHSYTLGPEGLLTRTGKLEAFIEWSRVRAVRRTRRFILIDVAPGLYHALPRHSFGSSREYQAFWTATRHYTSAALSALH